MVLNFWKRWVRGLRNCDQQEQRRVRPERRCQPRLEPLDDRLVPATITVTGTGDTIAVDGLVTLREAITSANSNADINADVVGVGAYGVDTIAFNIAGAGVKTITPGSALPAITGPAIIDGYTQAGTSANTNAPNQGTNAVLLIELNLANADSIRVLADNSVVRGLVINRAPNAGITVGNGGAAGAGTVIEGNFIGTNPAGTDAGPGNGGGVVVQADGVLIGGTTPDSRNLISGNAEGVAIGWFLPGSVPSNARVQGNLVGTNATGTAGINQSTSTATGTVGILIADAGGNHVIGGTTPAARNIISGFDHGIRISDANVVGLGGNKIQGNYIGLYVTGAAALPNRVGLVDEALSENNLIGGPAAGEGNVISGNRVANVQLSGPGNVVQGNFIGTNAAGTAAPTGLPSGAGIFTLGVDIFVNNNTIGGTPAGAGNVIAFNGGQGVFVDDINVEGVSILGNFIFSNGRLGIDLLGHDGPAGVNQNNSGPFNVGNRGQNYPVITGASANVIAGTFHSEANGNYRLEFFASAAADPTGFGEGQTFLGFATVNTDAGGNATFSFSPASPVPAGQFITATATDVTLFDNDNNETTPMVPRNNTSEFSGSVAIPQPGAPDLEVSVSDGVTSTIPGSTLTYTLDYANVGNRTATGVKLTESLPAGTTFSAGASTAGWAETAPGSGVFKLTVGSLAGGNASGSAVFVVTVNNPAAPGQTQIVNTASIADDGSKGADSSPTNNTATDTDTLNPLSRATDVNVRNAASALTIHAGKNVRFTLVVQNLGSNPAVGITLSDAVPAGSTFVSFTVPGGWVVAHTPMVGGRGTVGATRSSLAAGGAFQTFQLVVRVGPRAAAGTRITDTAQVATSSTDTDPTNNSASASVRALRTATRMTFTLVGRFASYRSELGLFLVDDAAGRIGSVGPGEPGYARAALSRRQFFFDRLAPVGTSHTLNLPAGSFYGWYLVQNSSSLRFLASNAGNRPGGGPLMFFSFRAANPDATGHLRQLTWNRVGFEDLTFGGDRDFNDLIVDIGMTHRGPPWL